MTDYDPFNKPPRKRSGRGGNYVDPPAQHRFKPGQSGNPRGRPKESTNQFVELAKLLRKKKKVAIDGQIQYLSHEEIIRLQLIHHSEKGSLNHTKYLYERMDKYYAASEAKAEVDAEKEALVDNVMRLMKALIQTQTQDIQPNPITLPGDMAESTRQPDAGMVMTKAGSPTPTPAPMPVPTAPVRPPAPKPQPTEEEMRAKAHRDEILRCISRSPNPSQLAKAYWAEEEAKKRKKDG